LKIRTDKDIFLKIPVGMTTIEKVLEKTAAAFFKQYL
jgi:hypothetical protein